MKNTLTMGGNSEKVRRFTTTSEVQYESQLSYSPSAGGAKTRRAFTLVETMVAVSILAIAVAGPMVTASRAYVAAEIARDQLTASYLAQEGIEYVHAMRDDEYLLAYQANDPNASIDAWTNFKTSSDPGSVQNCIGRTCQLDPQQGMSTSLQTCTPTIDCTALYLTNCSLSSTGLYCDSNPHYYTQQNQAGSVQTPFTRTITITFVTANDLNIVSTVSWTFHGTQYSVNVSDDFTPWQ